MKEFKGTPGPWVIDGLDVGAQFNIDSGDGGTSIGITSQIFRDKDNVTRRANTQLIAAAPELLELVISANRGVTGSHTAAWQEKAQAVISKALGESQ